MAQKLFNVEGLGEVLVAKRRGTRNLRVSINPKGQIRVGMPAWAPYSSGVAFALSQRKWIEKHQQKDPPRLLVDGQAVGKSYRLMLVPEPSAARLSAKVGANVVKVKIPVGVSSQAIQAKAKAACELALKREAEKLLPIRIDHLCQKHDYSYKKLSIKKLSSRWGSCSHDRSITLSIYLMQLPWELIDYVILHELTHTKHLNHSQDFWQELKRVMPRAPQLRKDIRAFRPFMLGSVA